jgi:Tfp pilus assembly protein PilV
MSKHTKYISKSGITLVEVIIAIVVFGVGILSILKILGSNIIIIQHTKFKAQATLLAKEGMEIVYNMRDSNLDRSFEWNCVKLTATQVGVSVPSNDAQETIQTSSYDCMSWAYLQGDKSYLVSYDLQHHYQITELWSSDGRLYYDDSGILTHQQTPSPSVFRRIIRIDHIASDHADYSSGDLLYHITSTVRYQSSTTSGSVSLQSLIGLTR